MSPKLPSDEISKLPLGKKEYVHDERTLMLASVALPDIHVPQTWDFDRDRRPFPVRMWGNDAYGDCVIAGRANHLLRIERVEQRRTIALFDDDAINCYKVLSGAQSPGDANDNGLVVLEAMRDWRNNGWQLDGRMAIRRPRNYSIYAFGELDVSDRAQMRMASYVFHGVHLGFWLPRAAQGMTNQGLWDFKGESGPEWQPGSWGGHLVYSKAFDAGTLEILTWGRKVRVTNSFLEKYCDEAWAVVDSADSWRTKQTVDVGKLSQQLQQISHKVDH